MKKFKTLFAAASALALCAAPISSAAAELAENARVSETAGKPEALSIPDEDIKVDISKRTRGGGGGIAANAGEDWSRENGFFVSDAAVKSNVYTDWTNHTKLGKSVFHFSIKVPDFYTAEEVLDSIRLDVAYVSEGHWIIGATTLINKSAFGIILDESKSGDGYSTYYVSAPFAVYGNVYKVDLLFQHDDGSPSFAGKRIAVGGFAASDDDIGYTRLDASLPEGESVHALFNADGLSNEEVAAFGRNLCRYINSLSDITGIVHKDIYVMFDEPHTGCLQCNHFTMSFDGTTALVMVPIGYNAFEEGSGLVSLNDTIASGRFDWGLMHELSHCYSFTSLDNRFAKVYNYALDDAHANARGAVAMENCEQLRDVSIVLDGREVGSYDEALCKAGEFKPGQTIYDVIDVFGRFGKEVPGGWVALERYFGGEYDSPDITNNVVYGALETVDETEGRAYADVLFKSPDAYRFINSMHFLSTEAASEGYGPTKEGYKKFLKEFVGDQTFADFAEITNRYSLWEACVSDIRGDLDLDGKVTATDLELAERYVGGFDVGLAPEGAFNLDFNQDGYVNSADVNLIRENMEPAE